MASAMTVLILMGSDSDLPVLREAKAVLSELGVQSELRVLSAHRTPDQVREVVRGAEGAGVGVIIAGAGGAAHLAGAVAAQTQLPVVGVPVANGPLLGFDALLSTVQMPPGIPVATVAIGGGRNAGILAAQILSLGDAQVREALRAFRARMTAAVEEKDRKVRSDG